MNEWRSIKRFNNYVPIIAVLTITALLGFFSAYDAKFVLLFCGFAIYLLLVLAAIDAHNIKKILPLFLILILFQDTLMVIFGESSGQLFSYLDEFFILVCLPALFLNFLRGKEIKGKSVIIIITLLAFLGTASSFIQGVPPLIAVQGFLLMTKGLIYLLIFINIPFNKTDLNYIYKFIKGAALIILLFAVVDFLMPSILRGFIGVGTSTDNKLLNLPSLQSLFVHPNIFGWFMVLCGAYALAKYKAEQKINFVYIACLFFLFAMMSFRFKTVLAILFLLLVFYLSSGLKKSLVYLLPASLVMLIVFLIFGDYFLGLTDLTINRYISADVSDSARKALYQVALMIGAAEFPFGVGFGRYGGFIAQQNYSPVYYEYNMNGIYGLRPEDPRWATDTYWPHIIGEIGFIGTFLLLGLLIFLIVKLFRNYQIFTDNYLKAFVFFAGLALVHAVTESVGEPIFNSSPQNVFVFVIVGIALSIISEEREKRRNEVGDGGG